MIVDTENRIKILLLCMDAHHDDPWYGARKYAQRIDDEVAWLEENFFTLKKKRGLYQIELDEIHVSTRPDARGYWHIYRWFTDN